MRGLVGCIILFICLSCERNHQVNYEKNSEPVQVVRIENTPKSDDIEDLQLSDSYNDLNLTSARNIGEFFDHRVKFFKIDNPDMTIGHGAINEIILYYIDSTLARIRYEVTEDVSNHLMDSLGVSRFKPLDERSKELLKVKKVWNKYTRKLHSDLKNYELVWREPNTVTRFQVHKDEKDSINSFLYYHEMTGYTSKMREIEALYTIMDKATPIPNI